jgi:hypothetical protein
MLFFFLQLTLVGGHLHQCCEPCTNGSTPSSSNASQPMSLTSAKRSQSCSEIRPAMMIVLLCALPTELYRLGYIFSVIHFLNTYWYIYLPNVCCYIPVNLQEGTIWIENCCFFVPSKTLKVGSSVAQVCVMLVHGVLFSLC